MHPFSTQMESNWALSGEPSCRHILPLPAWAGIDVSLGCFSSTTAAQRVVTLTHRNPHPVTMCPASPHHTASFPAIQSGLESTYEVSASACPQQLCHCSLPGGQKQYIESSAWRLVSRVNVTHETDLWSFTGADESTSNSHLNVNHAPPCTLTTTPM